MLHNSDKPLFYGIRQKLITIFIGIKVLPLIALALFAAHQIGFLGLTVKEKSEEIVADTRTLVTEIGSLASENSVKALDVKAREAIERLTTDTALGVADFLHARDNDILLAAELPTSASSYEQFLAVHKKEVVLHQNWLLSEDGSQWLPPAPGESKTSESVRVSAPDNEKDFHYRKPVKFGEKKMVPLYHEITFVDLDGQEKLKISTSTLLGSDLRDISRQENTWCRAENYFSELAQLQRGEIYVSKVIGPYLPSPIIGPYTPAEASRRKIAFAPEDAGYAGKENPVGKRFQGIIRWATPIVREGVRIGYVTLALDHTHVMEFTDHLVPTEERFTDISDAGSGNYAFMWDVAGRNISHPRDYFIVGYDPATGEQAVPWLTSEHYEIWQGLNKSFSKFEQMVPQFQAQSLQKSPAEQSIASGMLGLDCRYLNFAPQCSGWNDLTAQGGSGSFVIFWSELWKLTTAATIPYYTGMYKHSPRGFGYVTIGANVDEFHAASTATGAKIDAIIKGYEAHLDQKKTEILHRIDKLRGNTLQNLTLSTAVMIVIVVYIALWLAATLTKKISAIISGLRQFQAGQFNARLTVASTDELGQLAEAFNEMADNIQKAMREIRLARDSAEQSDKAKSMFLANMSHEIRTPMNAIIGMSTLALDQSHTKEQRKMLEAVKSSADALLAVINDILDFSKIEAGQFDFDNHAFSLHTLIASTMKSIAVLAEDKNIKIGHAIAANVPERVQGDQMRLRQILLNLLGNAVKFTQQGIVSLEVNRGHSEYGRVELCFTIRDTGMGIAKEHLDMIFAGFSQGDESISRRYQGAGLGLAISRKLCRLMGGDITVTSEIGVGSVFTFTAFFKEPAADEIGGGGKALVPVSSMPQRLHVLLVEDNQFNRDLARLILEKEKHRVVAVAGGLEALTKLGEEDFQVVLMDIQMPELDGLVATQIIRSCETGTPLVRAIPEVVEERLRARLGGRHLAIIALTAHAMRGDKERCLMVGMDDYLTKPFLPEQILAILHRHVPTAGAPPDAALLGASSATELAGSGTLYERAWNNINVAYALDEDKITSLLQTTVEVIRDTIGKMVTADIQQNVPELRLLTHSLKGLLLNLRFNEEAALAEKLQLAIDLQEEVDAAAVIAALQDALQEFLQ